MRSSEEKKAKDIIDGIISKAMNVSITSNVPLDEEQIELLWDLNQYSVNQILGDTEIIRDPRKIMYKSNQEFKLALVALCLSQSLTNPLRKNKENKELFEDNITITTIENEKFISFGNISPENVSNAIYLDVVEDWKIYRDRDGHGILSLINEKTNLTGLDDYRTGGDVLYEFARFQRKYSEKERKKEEKARESAQDAFRNAMVQSLAVEVAKQQLLEGKNPMDIVNLLFAPTRNSKEISKISKSGQNVDFSIEQSIALMLENKSAKDRDNSE